MVGANADRLIQIVNFQESKPLGMGGSLYKSGHEGVLSVVSKLRKRYGHT